MKHNYFILVLFVFSSTFCLAQPEKRVDIILTGGLNVSTVMGLDARIDRKDIKEDYTGGLFPHLGINCGGNIQFNFTENIALKTGIIYSGKGWHASLGAESFVSNVRFKLGYLDIPAFLRKQAD